MSFLNFILSLFNVILDGTNNSAELKAVYIFGIALERRLHEMQVFGRSKLIVEWFWGNSKKEAVELHGTLHRERLCCDRFL